MILSKAPKLRRERFKVARPKSAPSLTLNRYDLEMKNLYDRYSEWVLFHGCVDVRSLFYSTLPIATIVSLEKLEISLATKSVCKTPLLALSDFSTFSRTHTSDESLMYEIVIFEQIGRILNKGLLSVFKVSSYSSLEPLFCDGPMIVDDSDSKMRFDDETVYSGFGKELSVNSFESFDLNPKVYLIMGVLDEGIRGYFHNIEYPKLGLIIPYKGGCSDKHHLVDFENLFMFRMEFMFSLCIAHGYVLKPKFRKTDCYIMSCQPRYFDMSLNSIELDPFVKLVFQERFVKLIWKPPKVLDLFPWAFSLKIEEMIGKISDLSDFVGLDISMKGAEVGSVGVATFGINGLEVLNHVCFPGTKEDNSDFYHQSSLRQVSSVLSQKVQSNCVFFCLGASLASKILVPRVRGLCLIDLHDLFGQISIEKYCSYLGFKKTNLHDSGQDAKLCLAIFFYMAFLFDCRKFSRFKNLYLRAFGSLFMTKPKFG